MKYFNELTLIKNKICFCLFYQSKSTVKSRQINSLKIKQFLYFLNDNSCKIKMFS
jgi:hypothetical protein